MPGEAMGVAKEGVVRMWPRLSLRWCWGEVRGARAGETCLDLEPEPGCEGAVAAQ